MTIYLIVLTIHSYLRWVVLALALIVLFRAFAGATRAGEWTATDGKLHSALLRTIDLQFLLGLALYIFLSPITQAFFANVGAAMKERGLRFFGLEHIAGMVVAIAIMHIGAGRARKAPTPRLHHRRVFVSVLIGILVIAASIPWPFLPYGRPLFRI